jgi:spore coat protein B
MIKLQTDSNDEWQGFNEQPSGGLSELISGKGQNTMSMNGQGMRGLVGREVKINRGGPDAIQGTLMDVRWDYMAVSCKEGMVYVNDAHVKSITDTGRSGGARGSMGNPIPANTLLGVMQALRFRPVQINRGGPEKVEGILADANQSQLILTLKNQEIIRIPLQHVKSVSLVRGSSNNNSNNSGNNGKNTSQGNKTQNTQSGGNRSQGNRSAGNQACGNKSQGNKSGNNKSRGNQSHGNKSGGNKSRGNQSRGNKSGGKR